MAQQSVEYASFADMEQARQRYFEDNGFGVDGGYNDAWVDFKLGPVPLPFRNTVGRVRAVRYHDLHHVLTGYATDLRGELEISAWEVGAGCRGFLTAWQLNLGGMALGSWLIPVRSWRAFVRGRRSSSLYGEDFEPLLKQQVAELRQRLHVTETAKAELSDIPLYALAVATGIVIGLLFLAVMIVLLPLAYFSLRAKRRESERSQAASPAPTGGR